MNMTQKYLLGIDLGNTKTEYLLCAPDGEAIDIYKAGSPGRESFAKLFDGMMQQLSVLLERNGIRTADVGAAGIGLSITYRAKEKKEITEMAKRIFGIGGIDISTDTGHGTYADWLGKGAGIYSFASTGDIAMGLTNENKWISIGGMRLAIGNEASGTYLYRKSVSLLYDYYCCCGKDSTAFPELIALLGLDASDLHRSLKVAIAGPLKKRSAEIIRIMDDSALAGDEVAMSLFNEAGKCAGRSSAGCIRSMTFREDAKDGPVPIVLVGSIWNKVVYDGMRQSYLRTVQELTGRACLPRLLEAPPAVGGALRAKEKADGKTVTEGCRKKALDSAALLATEKELANTDEGEGDRDCGQEGDRDCGQDRDRDCGRDAADMLRRLVIVKKNKPLTAAKLETDRRILELLADYPMLRGVGADLAAALLPAIGSVMRGDFTKALERLGSASRHVTIAREDIAAYYSLAAACASAASASATCACASASASAT